MISSTIGLLALPAVFILAVFFGFRVVLIFLAVLAVLLVYALVAVYPVLLLPAGIGLLAWLALRVDRAEGRK